MSETKFRTLGDIGTFVRGNGLQKKDFVDSGIPCIHYGQVHTYYGTLVERTISFVVPEVADKLRKAQKGDIVIVCTSENVEDVCKCIAWLGDEDVCVGGETYIFKHNQDPKYLAYYFQTNAFSEFKKKNSTGTKVFRVHESALKDFLIPLPPLEEQERIASALSSVDELLASLDKQIAKTRDIRQGAMQQLLTGAKRLKGFSGQWTSKKLGDHADIYRGGSPRPIESFITDDINGINWIKIGDVDPVAKYIRSTAEKIKPSGVSSTRLVHKGDLILSNSMSFGRPYILELDGAIHDGWLVIQNYQKTFNTDFLYYALSSDAVMAQYKASAAGSSVQNLNKDKVADVVICAPDSLDEQKRIASVLTSLDDTIECLEAKRQKYESIKAGMMQQLLTGTIRLS